MRKVLSVLFAIIALAGGVVAFQPSVAQAKDPLADACSAGGSGAAACKSQNSDNPLTGSNGVLTNVSNILAMVGGIIVVIIIIVGGIKYATSGGDSAATASAKNTIIFGLIGLVVIILARSIISFVLIKVQ